MKVMASSSTGAGVETMNSGVMYQRYYTPEHNPTGPDRVLRIVLLEHVGQILSLEEDPQTACITVNTGTCGSLAFHETLADYTGRINIRTLSFDGLSEVFAPLVAEAEIDATLRPIVIGVASMYAIFNGIPTLDTKDGLNGDGQGDFFSAMARAISALPGGENFSYKGVVLSSDENATVSDREIDSSKSYILMSGGPDCATLASMTKRNMVESGRRYDQCPLVGLHINFGAPYEQTEVLAASEVARDLGIPLEVLDLSQIAEIFKGSGELKYPIFRELLPLTMLIGGLYAKLNGADTLLHGHIKEDEDDVPGTLEFFNRISAVLRRLSGDGDFNISAPFGKIPKGEVFEYAVEYQVPIGVTSSCLVEGGPCGTCRACRRRQDALSYAGLKEE